MQLRMFKLRFRKRLRKSQRQFEDLGVQTEADLEEFLFRRINRFFLVRRFVLGWIGLIVLLIVGLVAQNFMLSNYYQRLRPVPGGSFHEGMLGTFTTASPLYAVSDVDTTVSHLVFAGLFHYDNRGKFVGDLASGYEVDNKGLGYTVHLRDGLVWQDGKPLTAQDVVFTYQTIQNPDAQSPLRTSWQGISVTAPDSRTIVFTLPSPLASFPFTLTNGIVPEHVLAKVPVSELRTADFNTVHPVGAGPFEWEGVQVEGGDPSSLQEQVGLKAFERYHAGQPKLQEFVVRAYSNKDQLVAAAKNRLLQAVSGLDTLPQELKGAKQLQTHNLLFNAATMVFFKTTTPALSDQKVRAALVQSVNVPSLISMLGYPTHQVREPFLTSQFGYDPAYAEPGFDTKAAAAALDQAGWTVGKNGMRSKDGQPLQFKLAATDSAEYRLVSDYLEQAWARLGVNVQVQLESSQNFQTTLSYHDYDAVLYGITIGADPDVYVYWDSAEADIRSANRLNLSEYKNPTADTALEAGRTRLDPALRIVKYRPFLQAWQQDLPALGLYQPRLLYLTNGSVSGMEDHPINAPTDRLANVEQWQIRQAKVSE